MPPNASGHPDMSDSLATDENTPQPAETPTPPPTPPFQPDPALVAEAKRSKDLPFERR